MVNNLDDKMDEDFDDNDFEDNYQDVDVESDGSYQSDGDKKKTNARITRNTQLSVSKVQRTRTSRASGKGAKQSASTNVQSTAGTALELLKIPASVRNLTRDYSFKQRFTLNYGFNESYYQHCLQYKQLWQDKLFYVDEKQLKKDYDADKETIKTLVQGDFSHFPTAVVELIDRQQLEKKFQPIELQLTVDSKETSVLKFAETSEIPIENRDGVFLNAGGHITSMKWLPTDPSNASSGNEVEYLATAVIQSASALVINDVQLGLFSASNTGGKVAGGIQVWKYNTSLKEFSLYKFYITSESIGIATDLSWIPQYGTDDVLGVLSATFSDGKLHLLKIDTKQGNEPELAVLLKPSVSYSLPGDKITCYDFLGSERIVVGASRGSIGEFVFPSIDSSFQIPSYIQLVTEAPITSITAGKRELSNSSNSYTILINTAGAQCFAIEYQDFQHGRVDSWATNSLIKPIYNQNLKLFVSDDSQDSLTYSFVRHPHEKSTFIMKVDGTITSFHQSEILNHPLNLNGNSLGEVHIINISRKILNGSKATNKVLQPLRLWKLLQQEGDLSIHINGELLVSAPDKVTKFSIAPPEVSISALAWNENLNASSLYSAASVSGLLILEKLDK